MSVESRRSWPDPRYPLRVVLPGPPRAVSAYYGASVAEFLATTPEAVIGLLAMGDLQGALEAEQRQAWEEEIDVLRCALEGFEGMLFLEFDVPRLGSRIDAAAIVSGAAVFAVEFKCGERHFAVDAYNQAWDYALDLKNFHQASHNARILPILVATRATDPDSNWQPSHEDGVYPPRRATPSTLRRSIEDALGEVDGPSLDGDAWARAPYQPTPTIIEAARALYSRHTVDAITRNDAGAKNLQVTSSRIEEIIEHARANHRKAIIFVTGVPGAGKTLVGLNVATRRRTFGEARAVFLSGNGPLVAVLQEALTRDEYSRLNGSERKGAIRQKVKPFIQNVHHFRDEGVRSEAPPFDHVVIFDEAQRAWNQAKTADFMKRKKGRSGFTQSESEFLISYLDRHDTWAVVVCLVGGGQEIHTGEAGIGAWLEAVRRAFPTWRTYVSPDLAGSEYAAAETIDALDGVVPLERDTRLHLNTSMRSFRSEKVSGFVTALLDCELQRAQETLRQVTVRYPIVVTRDLARAKEWVRSRARGSEQFGLVASSQAILGGHPNPATDRHLKTGHSG